MEKRERRNRSRRPRDAASHNGPPPKSNTSSNAANNKVETKPVEEKTEKKVIDHTAIPDPHMFDNLKRETEEIAALKTRAAGGKRQIFSNWAKYEAPIHDDSEYESGKFGADFEALLELGGQNGGHFKFKSEDSWDPENLSVRSTVFTLDLVALADGLSTIPFYKRLNIPKEYFTDDEIARMDKEAKASAAALETNRAKRTPQAKAEAEKVSASILAKLMEREAAEEVPVEVDSAADDDLQPFEFNPSSLSGPSATAQSNEPTMANGEAPAKRVQQPQVVMPELEPRESPARSDDGFVFSSCSSPVDMPGHLKTSRQSTPTPIPVTKQHSPTPELQPKESPARSEDDFVFSSYSSPVDMPGHLKTSRRAKPTPVTKQHSPTPELQGRAESQASNPEPTSEAGEHPEEGQGGKGEVQRRQRGRHKGKDRKSWVSSDEGDVDVLATKVEPPAESFAAQRSPTPPEHVPQKQAVPQPPLPELVTQKAPLTVAEQSRQSNIANRGKKQEGETFTGKPPATSEERVAKEASPEVRGGEPKRSSPAPEKEVPKQPSKAVDAGPVRPRSLRKIPVRPAKKALDDDNDEELDFLLSLRHPVKDAPIVFNARPSTAVRPTIDDEEESPPAPLKKPPEVKEEALEDWLDSILDD